MKDEQQPAFNQEEQELFRAEVRRFVEAEIVPQVSRWEEEEDIPRAFWERLGSLGYLGLDYPELYGGTGSDFVAKRIFYEELSRCGSLGVALSVGVHCDMSAPYVLELGTEQQRLRYLPALISGKQICGIAITEPDAGSDVAAIRTRAERTGDQYILNGTKTFISNGSQGNVFVVAARTKAGSAERRHAGISLFIVERGTPGFSCSRKLHKMGCWSSDTAELSFQDCRVPASNLLGTEGNGFRHLMINLQRERLIISIVACAAANRVLEDVLAYAADRRSFGKPLAAFQAIRHRIVDMAGSLEVARTYVEHVCRQFEHGRATDSQVSIGKLVASKAASEVADGAVQIFGGYGYMREYPVERFYRDARLLHIAGGTSEILKEIVAKRLPLCADCTDGSRS